LRARASSPLPWLGGLLALYLLAPILAFVVRLGGGASSSPGLGSALVTSLFTATISAALITVLGVPLAYLLARGRGVLTRVLLKALYEMPAKTDWQVWAESQGVAAIQDELRKHA